MRLNIQAFSNLNAGWRESCPSQSGTKNSKGSARSIRKKFAPRKTKGAQGGAANEVHKVFDLLSGGPALLWALLVCKNSSRRKKLAGTACEWRKSDGGGSECSLRHS